MLFKIIGQINKYSEQHSTYINSLFPSCTHRAKLLVQQLHQVRSSYFKHWLMAMELLKVCEVVIACPTLYTNTNTCYIKRSNSASPYSALIYNNFAYKNLILCCIILCYSYQLSLTSYATLYSYQLKMVIIARFWTFELKFYTFKTSNDAAH